MSNWIPVKQEFKMGDTIFDTFANSYRKKMYFMPNVIYEMVGAKTKDGLGSVEGEYIIVIDDNITKHLQYQSVLRSRKLVLIEKYNKFSKYNFS